MIILDKEDIQNSLPFDKGEGGAEWLETNGLGGWASSSITGCNTRRYHGLLVAATVPPAERMSLVSKLDDTIIVNNQRFELSANNYGDVITPKGYNFLTSFTKGLFSEWLYEVDGISLRKTVTMVHGENTTLIIYEVLKAEQAFTLELLSLLSVRGYHSLMRANTSVNRDATFENDIFFTKLYDGTPGIFIKVPGATFEHQPGWYYHFHYSVEEARGLDFTEDLFTPGKFSVQLKEGDTIGIILSTTDPSQKDAHELFLKEKLRKENLLHGTFIGSTEQILTLAADQFIVKREISQGSSSAEKNDGATVIAGYHWFTDWSRDTMISLPGLCLATGRYDDAKKIIAAFAKTVSMGMLPNRFQDNGEAPEYNNVDGTLWYFIAAYKYLQATNDREFILREILPVLKDIIDWHFKGTRYNIHVADDGLLYAGEKGQQLTWMDARVGDWVVTPRMGKPVEIEALWYNVLKIFAEFLVMNGQENDASITNISAGIVKKSFEEKFWYAEGNYLYDVIDENGNPDSSLRPNQLFAISLPFALIEGEQAASVLQIVTGKLYTPVGLRSLSPDDDRYIGIYGGDQRKRDAAYHQGTVWSWLLGPYADALMKVNNDAVKVNQVIDNFTYHLSEAGIGTVSEIFDGDAPHYPKGCIAQAWGVAEILRVIKEYTED